MTIHRLRKAFQTVCAIGAGVSMCAMFAIIFVNSVRRYTTGKSFVWGEELPIYLAVYGVMFGLALAHLQIRHVSFKLIADRIPERWRKWLAVLDQVCVFAIGVTLAYSGWLTTLKRGGVEASSLVQMTRDAAALFGVPALENLGLMSSWLFAIAFGGALLAIAALFRLHASILSATDTEARAWRS